jgi:hypothetical protein
MSRSNMPSAASISMVSRIASPEMLLDADLLPHLICSPPGQIGGGRHEAGQHGDA